MQSSNMRLLAVTFLSACFMPEVAGAVLRADAVPAGFNKNFPVDARPKKGDLSFNHPYPVVQDSEDFDKDFVKDQNTDNGEYAAQMKYDKIRHQLTLLKKQAADKLERKKKDEADIVKHQQQAKDQHTADERAIEEASKEIKAPVEAKEPVKPVKPTLAPVVEKTAEQTVKTTKVVEKDEAKAVAKSSAVAAPKEEVMPTPSVPGIDAAKQDIAKAKADLEGCKKELADAKAGLKTAMDDLEKAKAAKEAAEKKLEQTAGPLAEAKKQEKVASEKFTVENKEQQAAEAAYLKQQRKVEAMKLKLQIAAKKVAKMRDAEDRDGGVYPKDPVQSAAQSQLLGVAAFIAAALVQMA